MTRICFDLTREPWIPVVRHDGGTAELGLLDALLQAHDLRAIRDPLPTVEFGLYRLLVALALDIFEPRDTHDLEEMLEAGHFDEGKVRAYFAQWADRFDLLHPQHPFLQSAGMESEAAKPLAGLLHALPSGTNALHFHHGDERDCGVCPAVAARLLATIAPFMTAGGAGLSPSINGAPPWYALVVGDSLFQTVCLNLPVLPDLVPHARPDGAPAWRRVEAVKAERRDGAGLLESLTWQPRRIQLVPGGPGRCSLTGRESVVIVRAMKFAPGWGSGFAWVDPNVPYRINAEGRAVLRPQDGRAVWRDAGPLALLREGQYQSQDGRQLRFERPAVVTQFEHLLLNRVLNADHPLRLMLFGLRTDLKMKVFEWHREALELPTPLLLRHEFAGRAQGEMEKAEQIAYALGRAIKRVYPRDGAGNSNAFETLIDRARADFWTALQSRFVGAPGALLNDLATLDAGDDAAANERVGQWREQLKKAGTDVLNAAIDSLDSDAEALERMVAARNSFALAVWATLNPEAARQARERRKNKAAAGA